jgi:hypothetical protein
MSGPSATAPKMHMFMIIAVGRSFERGKPRNSGGAAEISSRLVHRPCSTRPTRYISGSCAVAVSNEPRTSTAA